VKGAQGPGAPLSAWAWPWIVNTCAALLAGLDLMLIGSKRPFYPFKLFRGVGARVKTNIKIDARNRYKSSD
jgi:hypothetical protein